MRDGQGTQGGALLADFLHAGGDDPQDLGLSRREAVRRRCPGVRLEVDADPVTGPARGALRAVGTADAPITTFSLAEPKQMRLAADPNSDEMTLVISFADGTMQYRRDMYDRDARLFVALRAAGVAFPGAEG